jgi:hypothetical protein
MSPAQSFALSRWGTSETFEQSFWSLFETRFRPWWDESAYDTQKNKADFKKYGPLYIDTPACTDDVGEVFDQFGRAIEERCSLPTGSIHSHRHRRNVSRNPYPESNLDFTLRLHSATLLGGCVPSGIIAAGESEWGTYGNLSSNYDKVRFDFLKLVETQAPIKVLIYGCHFPPHDHRSDTASLLGMFRDELIEEGKYRNGEAWLFIGISWGPGLWNPQVNVVQRCSGQLRIVQAEWLQSSANVTAAT